MTPYSTQSLPSDGAVPLIPSARSLPSHSPLCNACLHTGCLTAAIRRRANLRLFLVGSFSPLPSAYTTSACRYPLLRLVSPTFILGTGLQLPPCSDPGVVRESFETIRSRLQERSLNFALVFSSRSSLPPTVTLPGGRGVARSDPTKVRRRPFFPVPPC